MFKDMDEAFNWIESFTNLEKNTKDLKRQYRPERMKKLLEYFGNPQNDSKIIHLAGSKGKGSTSVLLSSALNELGLKTGLYTSPHVLHYSERIQISGKVLPDSDYSETAGYIRERLGMKLPGDSQPTTFEILTLMAFLIFKKHKCQWCVIETGLGGRLDATNTVIPEAVVLTPIEKEHTQWLGHDLQSIASEKAGIMKTEKPVFSSPQPLEVEKLFKKRAGEMKAPITFLSHRVEGIDSSVSLDGTAFSIVYKDQTVVSGRLSLTGHIQAWNAALALETLHFLFPETDDEIWLRGFSKASIPARMEVLSKTPLVICDGAHTPRSVSMALETFLELTVNQQSLTLLFACQDDKEIDDIARLLAGSFSDIIVTTPGFFKKSDPVKTYGVFLELNKNTKLEQNPAIALNMCLEKDNPLLIVGSFFLAGEIKKIYRGRNE